MSTIPTAKITLTCGVTSIALTSPPPGYAPSHPRAQQQGLTAAGSPIVYDKGYSYHLLSLPLVLTAAEKVALDSFFHTTTTGGVTTFDLTDHLGNTLSACRFSMTALDFQKTPSAMFAITLVIRTPSLAA